MNVWTQLARGCRRRCPRCGVGRIFRGWFRMYQQCQHCGLRYQREGGYFLGSIYFNYGLTALGVVVGYFTLYFTDVLAPRSTLVLLAAFSVLFPLWFFRYARSLWMALDFYFDPVGEGERNTRS